MGAATIRESKALLGLIAAIVVAQAGYTTWVSQYAVEDAAHDQQHVQLVIDIKTAADKLDKLEAYTRWEPRLRALLTAVCNGALGLRQSIDALKIEYKDLTGEDYDEPLCTELVF